MLLALLVAGAGERFVDMEHAAVVCYRLAPVRFKWRHYDYPSAEVAQNAAWDLERQKSPRLLTRPRRQSTERMLTAEGIDEAIGVASRIAGRSFRTADEAIQAFDESGSRVLVAAGDRRPINAELRDVRCHQVFSQWASGRSLAETESWKLADCLNCMPDSPDWVWRDRIQKLRTLAARWSDEEAAAFLRDVAQVKGLGEERQGE
jgi:hypothetical protein